jgi:hypothetical protein
VKNEIDNDIAMVKSEIKPKIERKRRKENEVKIEIIEDNTNQSQNEDNRNTTVDKILDGLNKIINSSTDTVNKKEVVEQIEPTLDQNVKVVQNSSMS